MSQLNVSSQLAQQDKWSTQQVRLFASGTAVGWRTMRGGTAPAGPGAEWV